jgi:hypothetical protein
MVASPFSAAAGVGRRSVQRAEPAGPAPVGFRAMGVLDDAIREHLELRRKHGATDDELHRQEMEALGPARREVGSPEDQELEPEGVESGAGEAAPPAEPLAEETASEELEPHVDEAALEESATRQEQSGLESPEEPRLDERPPDAFTADVGEEVGQGDLDEADSDQGGDFLEDTPEFLQETPEHDRLWFEQRPPRDFDFD